MRDMSGVELLRFAREISPDSVFILITGVPTISTAIDAVNFGADRYVIKGDTWVGAPNCGKPFRRSPKISELRKETGILRREIPPPDRDSDHIIGTSPKMREIFELIETIAPQSSRILITGESGTGKELVSREPFTRTVRDRRSRSSRSIAAAFPESLLESQLFGYVKGAFTGASDNRRGLFHAAHGG